MFRVWNNKTKTWLIWFTLKEDGTVLDSSLNGIYDNWQKDCVVERFTGFKDKDGVEIYEGDIVERVSLGGSKRVMIGEILFNEQKGAFVWRVRDKHSSVDYYLFEIATEATCEVISNIHTKYAQTLLG